MYCEVNIKLHAVTDVALNLIDHTDLTVSPFDKQLQCRNNDQLVALGSHLLKLKYFFISNISRATLDVQILC